MTLPSFPLCFRIGHTAKGCREYTVIKRKHKPNGHQNSSANNGGHASDNEEHKRRSEKEEARLKTDPSQLAMDVTSQGAHKSDNCPYRVKSAAAPDESQPKYSRFIVNVRRNLSSWMITSVGTLEDEPEKSKVQA